MSGVERSDERIRLTAEIFTPTELVIEILRGIPVDYLLPEKTVLDPACGDGQFLVAVKWFRMYKFNSKITAATNTLFGVDIMRDNVDLCKKRLGGGKILMGDVLSPQKRLPGQTNEEFVMMQELFGHKVQLDLFA